MSQETLNVGTCFEDRSFLLRLLAKPIMPVTHLLDM